MNPTALEFMALKARVARVERVLADFLREQKVGGSPTAVQFVRGYTEAGRHAMSDPPEGMTAAAELGYLVRKMEGN